MQRILSQEEIDAPLKARRLHMARRIVVAASVIAAMLIVVLVTAQRTRSICFPSGDVQDEYSLLGVAMLVRTRDNVAPRQARWLAGSEPGQGETVMMYRTGVLNTSAAPSTYGTRLFVECKLLQSQLELVGANADQQTAVWAAVVARARACEPISDIISTVDQRLR